MWIQKVLMLQARCSSVAVPLLREARSADFFWTVMPPCFTPGSDTEETRVCMLGTTCHVISLFYRWGS